MKTVLTIAGSDPSGGAGIQKDLETFIKFGCLGLSAITALTAQNSRKVKAVLSVPATFVKIQIRVLFEEYKVDAVKTGMLATDEIVKILVRIFKKCGQKNLVIDPVFLSTSGYPLLDKKGIERLKDNLIPLAALVTPNLCEASKLSGVKIKDIDDMRLAAERIKRLGCSAVLVKGGHLSKISNVSNDLFYDGKEFKLFRAKRVKKKLHGTGCMLSAGIAAGLANGIAVGEAIRNAKRYVTRVIKTDFEF